MFTKRHFEFGLAHCVKSVYDVDPPNFSFKMKGGQTKKIQWSGESSPIQQNNNNDDLDLYS